MGRSEKQAYPGFDKAVLDSAKAAFSVFGFSFKKHTFRGGLFISENDNTVILADHLIFDRRFPYAYTEYTKEQNALMHQYQRLYRFVIDSGDELDEAVLFLERSQTGKFHEDKIITKGGNRELQEIDPTKPEACFEQTFIDCFGRETLNRVLREFPVIDIYGRTRWVDYYIRKKGFDIAIEKNGEAFHHPLIIAPEQYKSQLIK